MKMVQGKICGICKFGIDESKEFARFTHFKKKESVLSESFYHINCFRERLLGSRELRKLQGEASKIMQFAKQNLGMEVES